MDARKIAGLDPGTSESAFVLLDGSNIVLAGKHPNAALLAKIRGGLFAGATLAVEYVASYGAPVGHETFETCVWQGRFVEAFARTRPPGFKPAVFPIARKQVLSFYKIVTPFKKKLHCADTLVRAKMLERYGEEQCAEQKIVRDCWSALALASFAFDMMAKGNPAPGYPESMCVSV